MHSSAAQDGKEIIVTVVGAGPCPGMLEKLVRNDDKKRPKDVLSGLVNTKK